MNMKDLNILYALDSVEEIYRCLLNTAFVIVPLLLKSRAINKNELN